LNGSIWQYNKKDIRWVDNHQMKVLAFSLALFLTIPLTACAPKTSWPSSPNLEPVKVQVGALKISQPENAAEFTKIRDGELLNAVRNKQITPNQARTFLKKQKTRLGLPNPNQTRSFDKILKKEGLEN